MTAAIRCEPYSVWKIKYPIGPKWSDARGQDELVIELVPPKTHDCHPVGNGSLECAARNRKLEFSPQRNISPPQDSKAFKIKRNGIFFSRSALFKPDPFLDGMASAIIRTERFESFVFVLSFSKTA